MTQVAAGDARRHDIAFSLLGEMRADLGESPLWCAQEQCVWWVDIEGCRVLRTRLPGGETTAWSTPEMAGFVVLTAPGKPAVGMQSGIFLLDTATGGLERIVTLDAPGMRFNDATVDAAGRLWAGTMAIDVGSAPGALYRIGADRSAHEVIVGPLTINGLAADQTRARLYVSDCHPSVQTVWRFHCDPATGALSGRTTFARFHDLAGRPDGAALDADGNYWIAAVGGGCLHVFSPQGMLLATHETPFDLPTKPAFCGANLDTVLVTSKRDAASGGHLAIGQASDERKCAGHPAHHWNIA
ncbi:SMP-30/gluconolactonase/LRE family protein [Breoghania sp. L-A4]|uniref:SMP-30/gluconolactonase/LRE family protein n=1 Tax=Breoghania sp. L-A4 TaxID=2304600 RepID=UPI000E35BF0F|nr:SMP-30/gluconolactonase/LRE family protein [Breoghania sp. L-A4]AXS41993.1 SMP-30/gluconolactonase/LRE family protein [Breoghania sp. L-A4]